MLAGRLKGKVRRLGSAARVTPVDRRPDKLGHFRSDAHKKGAQIAFEGFDGVEIGALRIGESVGGQVLVCDPVDALG